MAEKKPKTPIPDWIEAYRNRELTLGQLVDRVAGYKFEPYPPGREQENNEDAMDWYPGTFDEVTYAHYSGKLSWEAYEAILEEIDNRQPIQRRR